MNIAGKELALGLDDQFELVVIDVHIEYAIRGISAADAPFGGALIDASARQFRQGMG